MSALFTEKEYMRVVHAATRVEDKLGIGVSLREDTYTDTLTVTLGATLAHKMALAGETVRAGDALAIEAQLEGMTVEGVRRVARAMLAWVADRAPYELAGYIVEKLRAS